MTTAAICASREVSWRPSFYRGEQYDSDLGLYYLRARFYNPATGRFLSRDPLDGQAKDPASLHKYLYANGDPTNRIDPTGRGDFVEVGIMLTRAGLAVVTLAECGEAISYLFENFNFGGAYDSATDAEQGNMDRKLLWGVLKCVGSFTGFLGSLLL